jgi:F0F1-type ATP synthase assembly protein I
MAKIATGADKSVHTRAHLVEAVRAPIAIFTLALLIIEAILGGVLAVGHIKDSAVNAIVYGMVASLLLVLIGFLAAIFLRPNVLFQREVIEDPIPAFARIGKELTGNDIKILGTMLGKGANYFSNFSRDIVEEGDAESRKRQAKLEKMKLIETAGSEVALSMMGASFIQTVRRFSEINVEAPKGLVERIANPTIYFGATPRFEQLGANEDLTAVSALSPHKIHVEKNLTSDALRSGLIEQRFDIVHLLVDVNPVDGTLIFGDRDQMKATGFAELVQQTNAKLVVLATCDSLALSVEIYQYTNVVAATTSFGADMFAPWVKSFYRMMQQSIPISRAFNLAQTTNAVPMRLHLKQDAAFDKS